MFAKHKIQGKFPQIGNVFSCDFTWQYEDIPGGKGNEEIFPLKKLEST